MAKRILIMGLPGAGKTTLAQALLDYLGFNHIHGKWFNADEVRKQFDDWDFSPEGRHNRHAVASCLQRKIRYGSSH